MTHERDVRAAGCTQDFSRTRAVGSHWNGRTSFGRPAPSTTTRSLRATGSSPAMTPSARSTRRRRSSRASRSRRGSPSRSTGRPDPDRRPRPHQVPADPEPVVLASRDRRGRADDARSAGSWSRRRRAGELQTSSTSSRSGIRPRRFLAVIGVIPPRTRHVRALGRGFLRRAWRRSETLEPMAKALEGIRDYWVTASPNAAATPSRVRATSPRT